MRKLISLVLIFSNIFFLFGCSKKNTNLKVAVISDLHYASNVYYQYTNDYAEMCDNSGTGKQMEYLDDIFDAFIYQLKNENADYLVISGDLTFVGAMGSHIELAKKLSEIEENGAEVLVIPGNHDITYNSWQAIEGNPEYCDSLTVEEFKEIYKDFGYGGEISYDEESLSYVVDTKKGVRIVMIDSNLSYGTTYGKLKESTLNWFDEQLAACAKSKDTPIIVAHHNLYVHNDYFVLGYQISNYATIEEIMAKYDADLFLSGHLHPQHIVTTDVATEVASGAFCVYPHHYGMITVDNKGWEYNCYQTDVEEYARIMKSTDSNLLNYNDYGFDFFYQRAVSEGSLDGLALEEEATKKIYDYASLVNVYYFAGQLSQVDTTNATLFNEYATGTFWYNYITGLMNNPVDQLYATNKK